MRSTWAALLPLALAVGCSAESTTTYKFPDPLCLDFPWAALSDGSVGSTPPELACTTTLDCPPPLTCRKPREANAGDCELLEDAPDPSAPSAVYGVPEFLLSVAEGDDYNLIEFSGLPPEAVVLRCRFHICPPDGDVLRDAPSRCLYEDKTVNLGLTNGLALSVLSNGPSAVDAVSNIPACGTEVDGEKRPDRHYRITAVGYFAICYAFSETDLVAVSNISNLSRSEVGSTGQDAYLDDCSSPNAEDGMACSYTTEQEDRLGVCVGQSCCGPCWTDRDCQRYGGSTCAFIRRLGEDIETGGYSPGIVGFCSDGSCVDNRGDTRCVARSAGGGAVDAGLPDGGFPYTSAWSSVSPRQGQPCPSDSDSGVVDGGVDADMGAPPEMGARREMGAAADAGLPPDAAAAPDAAPPPDMRPRPDMGPPPEMP